MKDIKAIEKKLNFSNLINITISYFRTIEKFQDKFEGLNVFILNMTKYLTALKLVSEHHAGYKDYDFQNFNNSITRTFFCDLQFHLHAVIEVALHLDPKKLDTFNKLLIYIEKHQLELPKNPLGLRLLENLDLLYDIKNLRNIGQHFISKAIKSTKIKDRELASYMHMELNGSDLRISPEIFEYIIKRIQNIFFVS